ncbi:hypothetical protein F4821DRAFT_104114 [Hypoxylon rubiginosum]|uniref:Uncharacterized protein n=1 Tax=Hypoxylon rubiginosum TaxID=110542 RepID=A0ACC0CIA2_9PEZI|nr:hypothetical protein F4821DRAFT_104114 [Hypoxylon rubiginosum]
MGTPHQGGNGVQLGRALVNIASIFIAADDHILKHLEPNSEWLQQLSGQYGPISGDFVTKFAYETYKTHTKLGRKILVVPRASAVVPGQADAEAIGIHADHIHMVKFSSKNDRNYKKVSGKLQIMARNAEETVRSRWETEVRVDTARKNNVAQFSLPLNLSQVTDVPRFVAREDELKQMHEILGKGGERRTVILHGLGGMGKTQLAREYIKRHRIQFSAAIWLNARDVASLQQSFMQAAQQIHRQYPSVIYVGNAVQNRDVDEGVEAVKRWLEEPANTRWIVVYDNYDNPKFGVTKDIHRRSNRDASGTMLAEERDQTVAQDEDLTQRAFDIRPFLPGTYHGAVIITTRSSEVKLGAHIKIVKLADLKSSLEILASTSHRQELDNDEAACRLARRLDGLPLALATAGAYLEGVPSTTFTDYLTSYDASWRQLQESSPQILSYEDRALYSTWNLSFTHIQHQNPASATLLRLWAYFDNEDLWYELLREGLSSNGKDYVHGIVADKIRFDGAIRVLYNHGLVEVDASMRELGSESQGYSMHGCVHAWTQHILNKDEDEESIEMARVAMECVGSHVPGQDEREYWFTQRRLLKHADRCWVRIELSKEEEGDEWVYGTLGILYADQGRLAEAETMYKRALEGKEKAWGRDHTSTLDTVNNLGLLYKSQGRLAEAEAMYKRALEGKEKAWGRDHTSTLDTVNNLGILYADQGRLADAEAMYERALEGYEKAWGRDHTSTLNTVNNLGLLYANQGRLGDAETMYKRALEGYEKAWGPEHTSTLNTVNNLGLLYANQGRLPEAETMYKRALEGYEKAWGPEHTSTLNTVNNLGLLYADQGRLPEAEAMYKRALEGYEKAWGRDHTSTLNTVNNLGLLYANAD